MEQAPGGRVTCFARERTGVRPTKKPRRVPGFFVVPGRRGRVNRVPATSGLPIQLEMFSDPFPPPRGSAIKPRCSRPADKHP